MANTYASLALPELHGGVYKWTYSFWVKRSTLGSNQCMAAARYSGSYSSQIRFTSNDSLEIHDYRTSYALQKITTRKFRDTSNWYHIVIANDNSVSSPDLKIYINGVEETDFSTDNEYSQNQSTSFNQYTNYIGQKGTGADYFDGYLSHFHFIDGTAYTASTFGSTDSTTGEWKINTTPSVTYGDNGFFLLKNGNSLTDQSGNGNDFTLGGGTITDVKDNPSMVMATMNPLYKFTNVLNYSNGNTTVTGNGNTWSGSLATLGITSGKYYYEVKCASASNTYFYIGFGAYDAYNPSSPHKYGVQFYNNDGGEIYTGDGTNHSSTSANYGTFAQNDIMGLAVDYDNSLFSVYKNNVALVTNYDFGAQTYSSTLKDGFPIAPIIAHYGSSTYHVNFGNGFFGTTAITTNSGNGYAGAEGKSKFNYQPPTGYRALSTTGLNL